MVVGVTGGSLLRWGGKGGRGKPCVYHERDVGREIRRSERIDSRVYIGSLFTMAQQ